MDIHPLVIHFPIALLTLYSGLEIFKRFTKAEHWWNTRAVLVIAGTLSAFGGLSSGEGAEHLFNDPALHDVLEAHSLAATIATWIFAILGACYLVIWLNRHINLTKKLPLSQSILTIAQKILGGLGAPLLAILGFLSLSLTGALGAILVYGPEFDPITSLVYKLLFG